MLNQLPKVGIYSNGFLVIDKAVAGRHIPVHFYCADLRCVTCSRKTDILVRLSQLVGPRETSNGQWKKVKIRQCGIELG